jgi:glycosyltransferase involved in cell wall biosynthesis
MLEKLLCISGYRLPDFGACSLKTEESESMRPKIMNELISVIVPIYQVEQYLPKCVDSIRNQTYSNLEIILVDDGSPDHCPELCDEYARKDSRIRVIHKPNGGLSDARNAGIEVAKGNYICFVDSDDYVADNMLDRLYLALKEQKAEMSLCGRACVDENNTPVADMENCMPLKNEVLSGREAIKKLAERGAGYYTVAWCKLYRADLFQTIRFPVGKIHEDEFVAHLVFEKCKRVSCIAEKLYFYVQRKDSIMGNARKGFSIRELDTSEAFVRRALFLEAIGMREDIGKYYFAAIKIFSGRYSYGGKFTSEERERIREIYRLLRKNMHLGKGCSMKKKVYIMLALISPRLHQFVIKIIGLRHKNG